jgi:hypothetical protein
MWRWCGPRPSLCSGFVGDPIRPKRPDPHHLTQQIPLQGSICRHFSVLPADEVTEHDGIPVTTVPRTILDLAAVSRPDVVESALRQAEYLQLHDRLSLPHLLERHPRRRGTRAVRAALAPRTESTGRTRSALEERFLTFLDRHGLPRPSSTQQSRSAPASRRSTASGRTPDRSSSSTAGRATAPAPPSAKTAPATAACEPQATASPASLGPSSTMNPTQSLAIFGSCWYTNVCDNVQP